jgi:hypothetical protein
MTSVHGNENIRFQDSKQLSAVLAAHGSCGP